MGHIYGIQGAFLNQWRAIVRSPNYLNFLISAIPTVYVVTWFARKSDDPAVLSLIVIGAPLMVVWNSSVFRMGYSVTSEWSIGALEFSLASRTPLILIMLGKALGMTAFILLSSLVALVVVVAVSQESIEIARVGLLIPSICLALFALFSAAFVFAPLTLLVVARPGFFGAIMPFGVAFSGFLYPVTSLPNVVQPISWFLPTSWAVRGVVSSIEGGGPPLEIVGFWGVSLLMSTVYWGLSFLLFKIVETRVRVTGVLSTF